MLPHPPTPHARSAVIGLGGNLGDREATLGRATEAIAALRETRLIAASRLRETSPVGGPPQGPYLNGAVRVETRLSPRMLLDILLSIERRFGRERRQRWGPRTLDLDLLWIAGVTLDEPGLTVPHPRLTERRFALEPLVEVAPEAFDPATGEPYADILNRLPP